MKRSFASKQNPKPTVGSQQVLLQPLGKRVKYSPPTAGTLTLNSRDGDDRPQRDVAGIPAAPKAHRQSCSSLGRKGRRISGRQSTDAVQSQDQKWAREEILIGCPPPPLPAPTP